MKKLLSKIKTTFVNGILITLPLGLTLYILWLVYKFINNFTGRDSYLGTLISQLLRSTLNQPWFPGIGIILTFLFILLMGLITRIYIGRKTYQFIDATIEKTPLISKMYGTLKQITMALFNREVSSFQEVVLIEYPRRGMYSLGFVTNEELGKLETIMGKDAVAVFLFTTPNPLTGRVVLVPRNDVSYLDLSVEEGLRLVLSMGIVIPQELGQDLPETTNRSESGD